MANKSAIADIIMWTSSEAKKWLVDKINQALWQMDKDLNWTNQRLAYREKDANWQLQPVFKPSTDIAPAIETKKQKAKKQEKTAKILGDDSIYANAWWATNQNPGWNPYPSWTPAREVDTNKLNKLYWITDPNSANQQERARKITELNPMLKKAAEQEAAWWNDDEKNNKSSKEPIKKKWWFKSVIRWVNDWMNSITRWMATVWMMFDPNNPTWEELMDIANWITDYDEWEDDWYVLWRLLAWVWQLLWTYWMWTAIPTDSTAMQYMFANWLNGLNNLSLNDLAWDQKWWYEFTPEKKAQIDANMDKWLDMVVKNLKKRFGKTNTENETNDDLYL